MNFYSFLTRALAQAAADLMWSSITPLMKDTIAATGQQVTPPVTTAYAVPRALTDGSFIIPTMAGFTAPLGWVTRTLTVDQLVSLLVFP